ncbi:MAG: MarR family transcriptional regulator [Gaiellaceae bacterium]
MNRTDLRCLNIIENNGAMTAGRLAELSGLTTAAVTSVLDRLERAGYARRVRDQPDRRQVMVEVTPLLAERATPKRVRHLEIE